MLRCECDKVLAPAGEERISALANGRIIEH
jgi:hypothetical protein